MVQRSPAPLHLQAPIRRHSRTAVLSVVAYQCTMTLSTALLVTSCPFSRVAHSRELPTLEMPRKSQYRATHSPLLCACSNLLYPSALIVTARSQAPLHILFMGTDSMYCQQYKGFSSPAHDLAFQLTVQRSLENFAFLCFTYD